MQKVNLNPKFPQHLFAVINDSVDIAVDPKILILIPSKERNDLLFQCIDSIKTHTSKSLTNIEVCIIDTGSSKECVDEIWEYAKSNKSHIKVECVLHNYYNFAKNNNQAYRDRHGSKFDYVVFCNNDIKLLNDCISNMLNVYATKPNAGTVGARLHFGDGKIQHLGVFCRMKSNLAGPGHYGFGKITTGSVLKGIQDVTGNTAALMMIRSKVYKQYLLSEKYNECFEDVQLNIQVGMSGLVNYCNLDAAAFHYESQSRNTDSNKEQKQSIDLKLLSNFIMSNRGNQFIKTRILE